jgi:hypothetical protein
MFKKILSTMILCITTISASEKIYIDEDQLDHKEDCFHIHIGGNVWLETEIIHRDKTGMYTFDSRLLRSKKLATEYKKTWKCPYCYQYWPIGTACKNPECPSKYKDFR